MNYIQACSILREQDKNISKINGTRFIRNGFEYRIKYCPGFCPMARVDRRPIGCRNFVYITSVDLSHCRYLSDVLDAVCAGVDKRTKS